MRTYQHEVQRVEELTELLGSPSEVALRKQLDALDEHMTRFIEQSPFALLGTVGRDGSCDVSPRGDQPSVARVLDPSTLVIPDRPGNRRVDSLRNIVETGRLGLLFLIPGMGETLRVNGRARVVRDEPLLAPFSVGEKAPMLGIVVQVEECFLQCAKAVIRSKLWDPSAAARGAALPCFARILKDQTGIANRSVEELTQLIEHSYKNLLY